MQPVSLKALSTHLGLSDGTVSRALNDYPDISSRTRARVKAAAQELGYTPNSNARRLATGDAECIGYLVSGQSSAISEPFLAELLDGLSGAIAERNWDLMLSVARSPEEELKMITRLVQTRRVNGLIISRTLINDPRVQLLKKLRFPFVTHGRTAESGDHAWFDVDNASAFEQAVRHLAGLGHRRIALISGPEYFNFAVARQQGYLNGMSVCGLEVNDHYIEASAMTYEGGEKAMSRLLALRDVPTAVVCASDTVALGAMSVVKAQSLTPGKDISIIGYDGLSIGQHSSPALSTMTQPLLEAGKQIGEMLLGVIDGQDPTKHQVLVKAKLERRETDGAPV